MGTKFRQVLTAHRQSVLRARLFGEARWDHTYDNVAAWHNAGLPKPPGTPIEIRARYLPKEKRWLVLVDSENPFVTQHPSLTEAMRLAGVMVEGR